MEEVKVIGFFPSLFAYRVIWALKLKGIEFEYVEEKSLFNKSEMLLKYNPVHKKVPVLVHGGKPIAESFVILEYIEEKWPEVYPLLPEDPYARAMARFWIKYGEDKAPIFMGAFFGTGHEQRAKTAEAREVLKVLEEQGLGDKKFFGGNEIGMTDLAIGWIAHWLEVLEEVSGVKVIEDIDEFPRLKIWMHNFREVPVIKDNLPDRVKMIPAIKRVPTFVNVFFGTAHEQQAKAAETREILKMLEKQGLGEKKLFGGNEIGMTGLTLGWLAHWLEVFEEVSGVKVIEDIDRFPGLKVWMHNFKDSCHQRKLT